MTGSSQEMCLVAALLPKPRPDGYSIEFTLQPSSYPYARNAAGQSEVVYRLPSQGDIAALTGAAPSPGTVIDYVTEFTWYLAKPPGYASSPVPMMWNAEASGYLAVVPSPFGRTATTHEATAGALMWAAAFVLPVGLALLILPLQDRGRFTAIRIAAVAVPLLYGAFLFIYSYRTGATEPGWWVRGTVVLGCWLVLLALFFWSPQTPNNAGGLPAAPDTGEAVGGRAARPAPDK